MKGLVFDVVMVTLIVFTNAKWTNDGDDLDFDLFEESLIHRYLLDEYLSFKDRETATFTEAQRKFQNDSLETHNILRARHCVPPLSNDNGLIHSTNRHGLFGENLYSVTRANPTIIPDDADLLIF